MVKFNWQLIGDRLLLGVIARKLFLSTQLKSTGVWPLEQGLQGPYRHKYWWWSLSGPQSQGLQPSNRLIWPWFMAWIWGQKAWNQHWMIVTSGVVMISKDSGNLTGISILMEPKLVPESLLVKVDFYHQQCHQRGQFLVTRWTNFLSPEGPISCSTEMHIQGDDCHLWGGDDQQGLREPHRHQHRGRGATLSLPLYCPGIRRC